VGKDDEVFCSTLTFAASANAICYLGAKPVFIDSDRLTWNMDPLLLDREFSKRKKSNTLPKAVLLVHIYGIPADLEAIAELCRSYNVPLIEDAAEALGSFYKGSSLGTFGECGVFSFNGNKIITASSGGMLVSEDKKFVDKVRYWSTQAREPYPYYEHIDIGYNYRMSNILAAIGRGQLEVLDERVRRKKEINLLYRKLLKDAGVTFMPEPKFGKGNNWLTVILFQQHIINISPEELRLRLETENIESRPVWKPMHMQPVFAGCPYIGGNVAEEIFQTGICLPSGTSMADEDVERIACIILSFFEEKAD
jgi:pyridoxal phosphate-dependent aminotransferase EpsN